MQEQLTQVELKSSNAPAAYTCPYPSPTALYSLLI